MRFGWLSLFFVTLSACNTGDVKPEPKATTTPPAAEGALRLGSPIESSVQKVALTDVAKNPNAYMGKKLVTTGTVTSVCQHMGCWMEIKDDSGEAHIKMAGHAFFVPKNASGRKARILASLEKNDQEAACADDDEGMTANGGATPAPKQGCKAEAEAQLGHPLAKLELVADGVELMN